MSVRGEVMNEFEDVASRLIKSPWFFSDCVEQLEEYWQSIKPGKTIEDCLDEAVTDYVLTTGSLTDLKENIGALAVLISSRLEKISTSQIAC